ncbi:hypothetical protein PHYBLDRAFT_170011 [Phycomyces blakesleeanus NRRL 1555(-)]|uniref:Uncharacterized protein n=1 Tax=Phycomyces blakesleeanus (strain ATCC 8743b / DSM 1359 / FGSC 10004 / NBRC 33097 / NRRL 1555) TaxID=763407 RepID=A0A167M8J2_PHYB8|nr:hypothetical protein PHYBLDRAFT_170011 [Phycomyces blakesleeanus NRRL 1555(-)]OAD72117.1 hypothetical protein PHYBLDRAFT_170011 [Phycomyces blakesleeanus NRRL 1555(-)]|eukprot:XP_018290157.1 hypothetical protein PHYBLDRAFT_170011 [Phycomyces blakesleeanus NRRL 1555(-)]
MKHLFFFFQKKYYPVATQFVDRQLYSFNQSHTERQWFWSSDFWYLRATVMFDTKQSKLKMYFETLIAILVVTLILIDLLTPIVKLCNSSTPFIYQKTTSSFTSSGLCDQASSTGINLDFSNLSQASISSLITRPKDNTYYMFSRKLRYGRK